MFRKASIHRTSWRRSPYAPADPARASGPAAIARTLLAELDRRSAYLPQIRSEDAQWRMILSLVIARESDDRLSVLDACQCSAVPQTTALRHIAFLEKEGIVVRSRHPEDGRSWMLALSDLAYRRVTDYLLSTAGS